MPAPFENREDESEDGDANDDSDINDSGEDDIRDNDDSEDSDGSDDEDCVYTFQLKGQKDIYLGYEGKTLYLLKLLSGGHLFFLRNSALPLCLSAKKCVSQEESLFESNFGK